MKRQLQVINSDHVNRYGMKFAVEALAMSVDQSWQVGVPSYIGHDMHRPIGWIRSLGLFFEPGATYHLGHVLTPETQAEGENIAESAQVFQRNFHHEHCKDHLAGIRSGLNNLLSGNEKFLSSSAVAVLDDGLAARVATAIFKDMDGDGLISTSTLLKTVEIVGPGIFHLKGSNWLLFAHPYFRRSQSRANNFHTEILSELVALAGRKMLDIRIALDSDMVGLASTYSDKIELAYWHGPPFNDDLRKIDSGVTRYCANDRQKLFSNVASTEFWWKNQGTERRLEAEELRDGPSGVGDGAVFGCRYIHAMAQIGANSIHHFDGAIRMYAPNDMNQRRGMKINQVERKTEYTKLFRIDGPLPVGEWKTLVTNYYQENELVLEYFQRLDGNADKKEVGIPTAVTNDPVETLCPYSIKKGSGIRLFVSYHPLGDKPAGEREAVLLDTITTEGGTWHALEHDVLELHKAIRKTGGDILFPRSFRFIVFEDGYVNLPLIKHGGNDAAKSLRGTLEAALSVLDSRVCRHADRVFSFAVAWPTATREVWLSLVGHAEDLKAWLVARRDTLPFDDKEANQWCAAQAKWLHGVYGSGNGVPSIGALSEQDGLLRIRRQGLPDGVTIEAAHHDASIGVRLDLRIPATNAELAAAFQTHRIATRGAFFLNEARCKKCSTSYLECPHSKWLDEDVIAEFTSLEPAGVFVTDLP